MAEGQENTPASEPSMEEILASIRKIIADDEPAKPADGEPAAIDGSDVLELTQMVEDDGSVTDLKPEEDVAEPAIVDPEPLPELEVAAEPEPVMPEPEAEIEEVVPMPVVMPPAETETLVSEKTATVASSALSALENVVQVERMASQIGGTPLGNGSKTLELMVAELMRPMLKEWLDKNLPAVVDKLVQREIERITQHKGH